MVTRFVNSVYSSNTFIISDDNSRFWLIDCGDADKIMDSIVRDGEIMGVFFTHTHYDHIYGINDLLKRFPDARIYTNAFGSEALMSPKLNFSKYHQEGSPIVCDRPENIVTLKEGDCVDLSDKLSVKVFETPGHDKSCLCYQVEDGFFSGDSYIPGMRVYTNFRNGNREDARRSLERIKNLCEELTLYPGHGTIYKATDEIRQDLLPR